MIFLQVLQRRYRNAAGSVWGRRDASCTVFQELLIIFKQFLKLIPASPSSPTILPPSQDCLGCPVQQPTSRPLGLFFCLLWLIATFSSLAGSVVSWPLSPLASQWGSSWPFRQVICLVSDSSCSLRWWGPSWSHPPSYPANGGCGVCSYSSPSHQSHSCPSSLTWLSCFHSPVSPPHTCSGRLCSTTCSRSPVNGFLSFLIAQIDMPSLLGLWIVEGELYSHGLQTGPCGHIHQDRRMAFLR